MRPIADAVDDRTCPPAPEERVNVISTRSGRYEPSKVDGTSAPRGTDETPARRRVSIHSRARACAPSSSSRSRVGGVGQVEAQRRTTRGKRRSPILSRSMRRRRRRSQCHTVARELDFAIGVSPSSSSLLRERQILRAQDRPQTRCRDCDRSRCADLADVAHSSGSNRDGRLFPCSPARLLARSASAALF